MNQENKDQQTLKISTPEKINRILQKVSEGRLSVIARCLGSTATAVRGRADGVKATKTEAFFEIGGISSRGLEFISSHRSEGVQIEFVLMSSKIVFTAQILNIVKDTIQVSIPSVLTNMERRKDARYPVSGNARAFIGFEKLNLDAFDVLSQPLLESTKELLSLYPLGDVSAGGISVVTRFPALCKILEKNTGIEKAVLHLPLAEPVHISVSPRWVKKLKENVTDLHGESRVIRVYRFGLQFCEVDEKLKSGLTVFIQKITRAEAI